MKFGPISNEPVKLNSDSFLAPFLKKLQERTLRVRATAKKLTNGKITLADFASGHEYFGLHFRQGEWIFREWAPNATRITLLGDFSNWQKLPEYRLKKLKHGVWVLRLSANTLRHGTHYRLFMEWPGGSGNRIPAYARYVVQDDETGLFSAMVWSPEQSYEFKYQSPATPAAPLIYEAHIGMAQEEPKIGTFNEFREKILPKIAAGGYNTIQLMAIMGHPYYGSFGYHVANFFAIASRFGTPDDFKSLIDAAHGCGLRVIIDLVHSHAVKNEVEGLAKFDGTRYAYFHEGSRGEHSAWDSLLFNYAKPEVLHFLLSNCRFYLDEYHIDGFRFDGVTSMMYLHHGLGKVFSSYNDYFDDSVDEDALTYLALANQVIHEVRPDAITIAEDVSGMPGLATNDPDGGIGFDYRMAMGVTDMWFKLFDLPDQNWDMFYLFHELTNRRRDERSVSYVESHDQAIVGGKTAIFKLADAAMYNAMHVGSQNPAIDRAIALHKMIRLATAAAAGHGYLNFMGNEFGHPEWIDFPREGNNWSLQHARRQWSLADNPDLRYHFLRDFDRAMLKMLNHNPDFYRHRVQLVHIDNLGKVIVFERDNFYFCFNFHPENSYFGYSIEVLPGEFETILDSDLAEFGGFSRREPGQHYWSQQEQNGAVIKVYLPSRTALVLKRI